MGSGKNAAAVTGSAGFIGSCLIDALSKKYEVRGIDNFSGGLVKREWTIKADILLDDLAPFFRGAGAVFHFAANPDVKLGAENTLIHVDQNILATYNVLEAMRKNGVKKIVFASSSTVYGNAKTIPTPEEYSPMEPVSVYGASKLASEALISAYCHTFGMQAWIFRLANIIGPGSGHGIIPDFIKKLKANPQELEILGDGEQDKSYLYIDDCISAILSGFEKSGEKINVFNVGSDDHVKVREIAGIISGKMNLAPGYKFTGGKCGWAGDVPVMLLDISKLRSLGWKAKYTSIDAVKKTVSEILNP